MILPSGRSAAAWPFVITSDITLASPLKVASGMPSAE
jgi:hypothetical protein